jgi:hypothetical protein
MGPTQVTIGLRVFTTNCRWGTVTGLGESYDEAGWFGVTEDGRVDVSSISGIFASIRKSASCISGWIRSQQSDDP